MTPNEVKVLQHSTLLAHTGLLVAASDADGRIALLSPGMQDLFDVPFENIEEEELSRRFGLFTADGLQPLAVDRIPLVRARRGEIVRDALIAARTADGRLLRLRSSAAPLRGLDGHISGAIVVVQDVTAEHAASESHSELRERLMETMNHQFRTPVTKILGYAELLLDADTRLPESSARAVDAIHRAAEDLADLLRVISALVDLEQHTELVRTPGDLTPALLQLVHVLEPDTAARGVRLVVELPPELPCVADFAECARAVTELLHNAVRYAPPGSEVVLFGARTAGRIELGVRDQGPGIPASEFDRVMQPFERDADPRRRIEGKGLGLAIAKTVAEAHGGELTLTPNQPRGLCATLRLPAR
jgi:signal transduction histidine kinase